MELHCPVCGAVTIETNGGVECPGCDYSSRTAQYSNTKEHSHCLRCHRKLKDLDSRQRGFGPICWAKHLLEINLRKGLF